MGLYKYTFLCRCDVNFLPLEINSVSFFLSFLTFCSPSLSLSLSRALTHTSCETVRPTQRFSSVFVFFSLCTLLNTFKCWALTSLYSCLFPFTLFAADLPDSREQSQHQVWTSMGPGLNLRGSTELLFSEMKLFWESRRSGGGCLSVAVSHHGSSSASVLPRRHQQEGVWGSAGEEEQGWSLPDPGQRDHPGSHVSVCLVSTLHSVLFS